MYSDYVDIYNMGKRPLIRDRLANIIKLDYLPYKPESSGYLD